MESITINPILILIVVLVIGLVYSIHRINKLEKRLKLMNVQGIEARIAQAVYSINSAHQTLGDNLTEIDNIREETIAYYQRIKYILDHSGWTAVRLQNLSKAIQEIGEGQEDTHVTIELEADNPNPNAPGESKKSESTGAEQNPTMTEMDPQQKNEESETPPLPDEDIKNIGRFGKLVYFSSGMGIGMLAYHFFLK